MVLRKTFTEKAPKPYSPKRLWYSQPAASAIGGEVKRQTNKKYGWESAVFKRLWLK